MASIIASGEREKKGGHSMTDHEQEVYDMTQRMITRLKHQLFLEWLNVSGYLRVGILAGLPAVLALGAPWLFGPFFADPAFEAPWPGLPAAQLLEWAWGMGLLLTALATVCCCAVSPLPALFALVVWPLTFLVDAGLPAWAAGMPPLRRWLVLGAMAALGVYQVNGLLGVRQR
jgi:hypothetical protein